MGLGKMEAARGCVWARGCLPVARTRAEVGQGAGSAVDFKIAPLLPRTLLLCHGLGGSWPRCAPCAAGEALHAWPAPLQHRSRCGAGRQGGVLWLLLPHARLWPCTSSAQGQAARGHPRAPSGQGTLIPRHPPGRLLGSSPSGTVPWSRWRGASSSPGIALNSWGVPGTLHPTVAVSALRPCSWDGSTPSACFPQGTGLGQEQTGLATPEPPREGGGERGVHAGAGKAQASP